MKREFRIIGRRKYDGAEMEGKWLDMAKCSIAFVMALVLGVMDIAYDVQVEYRRVQ